MPEKRVLLRRLTQRKWVPFFEQYCRSKDCKDDRRAQNKNHTSWKNIHDPGSDRAVLQRRKDSFPFLGSQDRYGKFQRCCKGNPKRDGCDHRAEQEQKNINCKITGEVTMKQAYVNSHNSERIQKKIKTEARQMKHGELSHVQLPGFYKYRKPLK